MSTGEIDPEVWEWGIAGRKWSASLTPEQNAWLDQVVMISREKEMLPNWTRLRRAYSQRWPESTPARDTIASEIRRRLADG